MSRRWVHTDDDDNRSQSSFTNSDDDSEESDYHTHRSCGRYGSCNQNKHQHYSADSIISNSLSKTMIVKGDIRPVPNDPGHRQKYDGTKWRRICSDPTCFLYLNGGVYFENWLCRKHYLIAEATDPYKLSNNTNINEKKNTKKRTQKHKKSLPPQSNDKTRYHKRGDILMNSDGSHQKYDGQIWRPVCTYDKCASFVVAHGYCRRHDVEMRNKTSAVLSSLDDPPRSTSRSNSYMQRPTKSTNEKVRKGDIQFVRQQWNGTKWYSLCHYYTRNCTRRSGGVKRAHLCDQHYREFKRKRNDENLLDRNDDILLSPKIKRKKLMSNDGYLSPNDTSTAVSIDLSRTNSTNDQAKHNEQCIQTDLTYPLDSVDLRQGCFLVEDDSSDQPHSQSDQQTDPVKKEEESLVNKKRKFPIDSDSLPLNCKLELIKLEI